MFCKLKDSLKKFDFKLYFSLIVLGLCPTIYTTVRIYFLGTLPSEWSYSIAGQLSWVNLVYEIISESIILPLFYFIGASLKDIRELTNRIKTGLLLTAILFSVLCLIIVLFGKIFLNFMATNKEIISDSFTYIKIESVANIFSMLCNFLLVVLITLKKNSYVCIITLAKLLLCIFCDTFFVSSLSFSFNLGVNGIGISNIIVNIILLFVSILLLKKEGIKIFNKEKISFSWMKELFKVGGISGLESFIRNIAYMLMIVRMVNVVNEQGIYWVANNFIWGWLLLPINELAEVIKRDCATDVKAIQNRTIGYFFITFIICLLWFITLPLWKPFMTIVLKYNDVEKLFNLVLILLGFYVLYAFQNIFDSTFYGLGKTNYMLFESIMTNSIYYGISFILYCLGIWTPSLTGIALLFGIGIAFDSIVSLIVYLFLLKKLKISIWNVEKTLNFSKDISK